MIGGGGVREWLGLEEVGYSLSQSNSADLLLQLHSSTSGLTQRRFQRFRLLNWLLNPILKSDFFLYVTFLRNTLFSTPKSQFFKVIKQ